MLNLKNFNLVACSVNMSSDLRSTLNSVNDIINNELFKLVFDDESRKVINDISYGLFSYCISINIKSAVLDMTLSDLILHYKNKLVDDMERLLSTTYITYNDTLLIFDIYLEGLRLYHVIMLRYFYNYINGVGEN